MKQQITRRDFLNGVSVGLASAAVLGAPKTLAMGSRSAVNTTAPFYPPTLTGMRGSHKGSFEVAHALAWRGEKPADYKNLNEEYDLIVVGAGISGLAAAVYYQQQAGKDKKVLLLDNHDDFGGHAKRNEFHSRGQMLLGVGGSGNFQDSANYSKQAQQFIASLGIDIDRLREMNDSEWPLTSMDHSIGMYTNKEHFGEDKIVNGHWFAAWHGHDNYQEMINALPLPDAEKKKLIQLANSTLQLVKPLPLGNMRKTLKSTSYKTFLLQHVGLAEKTCVLWDPILRVTYGVGVDGISILEAIKNGLPGAGIMGQEALAVIAKQDIPEGTDIVWFPDGNAGLTRTMVRRLIPQVAPGSSMDSIAEAQVDYSRLDQADHPVHLRLNSTAVNAVNNDDGTVSVSYVKNGEACRVKAKSCVMACNNGVIPHLCPEMSEEQKKNLLYGVRMPLLSVNVLARNSRAFMDAGSQFYVCPTSYFKFVSKAPPTTIGNYKPSKDADSPMLFYMLNSPTNAVSGNLSQRDLYRLGRHEIYNTSFEVYEKRIKAQLNGMFAATGFDADRDIEAITVNRWSHGYAYDYSDLFDPTWPEGQAPHELGRKQFGRISIANSDSHARAYLDAAIDAGMRAVDEQLAMR